MGMHNIVPESRRAITRDEVSIGSVTIKIKKTVPSKCEDKVVKLQIS